MTISSLSVHTKPIIHIPTYSVSLTLTLSYLTPNNIDSGRKDSHRVDYSHFCLLQSTVPFFYHFIHSTYTSTSNYYLTTCTSSRGVLLIKRTTFLHCLQNCRLSQSLNHHCIPYHPLHFALTLLDPDHYFSHGLIKPTLLLPSSL